MTYANNGTLTDPDYAIEIDCAELPTLDDYGIQWQYLELPTQLGDTVEVDLVNCGDMVLDTANGSETRVTAQYRFLDGAEAGQMRVLGTDWVNDDVRSVVGSTIELGPNTVITVLDDADAEPERYFSVVAAFAPGVADPAGVLLNTLEPVVAADAAADMIVDDEPAYYDENDDLLLGGIEGCTILPGQHYAGTTTVTIDQAGSYTFRTAALDPVSLDLDQTQAYRYLTDPFIALYSDFDRSDAHAGVLGCNDDSDLDEEARFYVTGNDMLMGARYPQFTVDLQPGTYTLVLTSWSDTNDFSMDSEPVALPEAGADPKISVVPAALGVDETASVEVWGPQPALADTGASDDAGLALGAGLALIALGGTVLVLRRRALLG